MGRRRLADLNPNTMPGPGDPDTWPPPTGRANDPRTEPEYDEWDEDDDFFE